MSQQSGGTPLPPEAKEKLRELGINPDDHTNIGDPADPLVVIGRKRKKVPRPRVEGDALVQGEFSRVDRWSVDRLKASDVVKGFYKLQPKERAELQRRLLQAGFYGPGATEDDIAFGLADEFSLQAFETAVGRTAAMNSAGVEVTLDEVIDEAIEIRSKMPDAGAKQEGFHLTNPEDIRVAVRDAAQRVLGRGAGSDIDALAEQAVASYQDAQRQAGSAVREGGVLAAEPSLDVFAEEQVRATDPEEADAYSYASKASTLIDFILSNSGGARG